MVEHWESGMTGMSSLQVTLRALCLAAVVYVEAAAWASVDWGCTPLPPPGRDGGSGYYLWWLTFALCTRQERVTSSQGLCPSGKVGEFVTCWDLHISLDI